MTRESLRASRPGGVKQEHSRLLQDSECSSNQANDCRKGLNWTDLMRVEKGGPGESQGRLEAIERAKARIRQRHVMRDLRRGKK